MFQVPGGGLDKVQVRVYSAGPMAQRSSKTTLLTVPQFMAYAKEANEIVALIASRRCHPFAAALAGVSLIKNFGGDPEWWASAVLRPIDEFLMDISLTIPPLQTKTRKR